MTEKKPAKEKNAESDEKITKAKRTKKEATDKEEVKVKPKKSDIQVSDKSEATELPIDTSELHQISEIPEPPYNEQPTLSNEQLNIDTEISDISVKENNGEDINNEQSAISNEQLIKEVQENADVKLTTETEKDDNPTKEKVKAKSPKPEISKIENNNEITDTSLEEMNADNDKTAEEEENEKFEHYSKEQLVEILEQLVKEDDINAIRTKVAKIKVEFWKTHKDDQQKLLDIFIANGGKKEDYTAPEDILEIKYNTAFNIYKEKRTKFLEEQEKEKSTNLQKKLQIIEELKILINSEETLKKTYDDFKALQERWKLIGQVPRTEVNNLWQNYHFLVEKFFDKVKINNELKDLDLKKNFERQLALCEKAEELLLEPSILKSFKQLQKYHDDWKEIGPVLPEKKEELWERFKSATDRINQIRHEYYSNLHEDQEKNYIAKSAVCEKGEQINSTPRNTANEWQIAADQINELQQVWRTIGYTPKKNNNEVWDRFRSVLNTFYTNRAEFFNKIKEEQLNNYNIKLALCVQAEALENSQEWKTTTSELIKLQNEWKRIGPVPIKYSNKIWGRFRKACDIFFDNKEKYFSNLDKNQDENLNLKLEIIKKINEFQPSIDSNENLNRLKEFQNEWMNIGHVPVENKDKIYTDFKAAINNQFEKLRMHSPEKTDYKYKLKVDELLKNPNADKIIYKETSFFNTKISELKNDIKLWENNIGFLASSKNADILKEEFTKKINSAKEQIVQMQEKLKLFTEAKKNIKK